MLAGLGPQPNFLDFRLMNVRAMEFLFLLILELAEVHDPTDRRLLVRSHLDEIEAGLAGAIQRLFRRDDPELFTVAGDDPDRRDPDLLVDAMLLLDGSRLPDSDAGLTPQAGKKANTRAMEWHGLCRQTLLRGSPGIKRRTESSPRLPGSTKYYPKDRGAASTGLLKSGKSGFIESAARQLPGPPPCRRESHCFRGSAGLQGAAPPRRAGGRRPQIAAASMLRT